MNRLLVILYNELGEPEDSPAEVYAKSVQGEHSTVYSVKQNINDDLWKVNDDRFEKESARISKHSGFPISSLKKTNKQCFEAYIQYLKNPNNKAFYDKAQKRKREC